MRIVTQAEKVANAAARWRRQYEGKQATCAGQVALIPALEAVTGSAQDRAAEIERLVGNESWTRVWCDECCTYQTCGVTFSSDESVTVCASCLRAASAAINAVSAVLQ